MRADDEWRKKHALKILGASSAWPFIFHEVLQEGPLFRFPLSEAPAITVILLIQMASWNAFRRTRRTEGTVLFNEWEKYSMAANKVIKPMPSLKNVMPPHVSGLGCRRDFFPSSSNNSMISSELDVTSSNAFWYFITSTPMLQKSFSKTFWYVSERLHGRSVKTSLQSLN